MPEEPTHSEPTRSGSLGETTYRALRRDVVLGVLHPGERLHLNGRARDSGVSLSVVREAAARLASEGLLESAPQRGFWVRELSVEDLRDLAFTRVHIERLALAESIEHGDLAWESALVAAHHSLGSTPIVGEDGAPNQTWMVLHNRFHAALAAACPHPRLLAIRQQLFDTAELYRYWSGAGRIEPKVLIDEHTAMMNAAVERDVEGATELLIRHLERTTARLEEQGVRRAGEEGEPVPGPRARR
jgi:DNA-binding GntR family transcriptional regulator